jgi:type IV secretory pathway VirB6-like protein
MSAPACSVCTKRDAPGFYKISHLAADGTEAPVTTVCSIRCMLTWGYQYASIQGARMAYGARQAVKEVLAWFK